MTRKKNFIGIVPGEWRHANELGMSPRMIRFNVAEFNNAFGTDEKHRDYILSGQQGYRMTCNLREIEEQIQKDHINAINRLIEIEDRLNRLKLVKKERLYDGRKIK
jgi:hypothetical protein